MEAIKQLSYLVATALFIFSLHWMNDPKTARRGVFAGAGGMLLAVLATWFFSGITNHLWIILAIAAGFALGYPLSRVPLTAVPQRTVLSHAFGGFAAGLVGLAEFYMLPAGSTGFSLTVLALVAEVLLGFLTFTGSLMATGKLQGVSWIPQRPVTYPYQNVSNMGLLLIAILLGVFVIFHPYGVVGGLAFHAIVVLALAFGVLLIIPIGGADMPTVISILNSYAGLSAVAMGFVLGNNLLITAGARSMAPAA